MKNTISHLSLFFLIVSGIGLAQNSVSVLDKKIKAPIKALIIEKDTLVLEKSSTMLDEAVYWDIIATSLKETSNQEDQELFLISEIEKLTPSEMIGFRLRTDKLLYDTYDQQLWCAAYIMNHGCSDGGFEYFRCWLISKGKDVFYATKANPDSLLKEVVKDQEVYEFEGFWYVAMNAFKNTTQKELFSYIDYEKFKTNDENYPILKFTWNVDEPETMAKICPVLYKNLWKK
ncbi:DUF4240 domain-containing protein [Flavobacterium sp. PL002]|uniref:DUF4240 domain-containing protein n=1 Tax=Flavobacterium sp. PL002 TaxID=1897058 RepID=UPI0017887B2B|nr:DUF4240 domain-containing protein [Flavobacterium sp. PL002]MBE0390827.1 hypothetical protein [Flavobacterium sp. PL002]